MNRLLELETVQGISDAKELRKLSDQVETNISRCLESLGLDPKSYGPLLIPIFMKKLPEEMKLIISREFDKVVWDIRVILEAIKREVQAREKLVFLLNRFWKRWKNAYLTELREFHKGNISINSELISDVVLITDEKQPRISWRVGRVLELIKGINDGVTLGEKVRSLCLPEQGRLSII